MDDSGLHTLDELTGLVEAALAVGYPGAPTGRVRDVPDQRAIRWYVTRGLVDRPAGSRGRVALYGRRHLLQLVAIKRRQAEGLTLAEIQAELTGATDARLAEIARIPDAVPLSRAPATARGRAAGPGQDPVPDQPSPEPGRPDPGSPPIPGPAPVPGPFRPEPAPTQPSPAPGPPLPKPARRPEPFLPGPGRPAPRPPGPGDLPPPDPAGAAPGWGTSPDAVVRGTVPATTPGPADGSRTRFWSEPVAMHYVSEPPPPAFEPERVVLHGLRLAPGITLVIEHGSGNHAADPAAVLAAARPLLDLLAAGGPVREEDS
ncbi:MAG TPA: MerR family transcriptional regulator [Pseudonocardiaceae bacterium]